MHPNGNADDDFDGCVTHDNKGEEVVEIASLLRVSYLCLCLLCHCVRDTNMETSSSQSHSCLKCNIKDRTEIQGEMHESY